MCMVMVGQNEASASWHSQLKDELLKNIASYQGHGGTPQSIDAIKLINALSLEIDGPQATLVSPRLREYFTIINSNPSSTSSTESPYYMVCQSTNYSEATTPVTVEPQSAIQTIAKDIQTYSSTYLSSIDNAFWNILWNVLFSIIVVVLLIYLFTKLGAYMKKNQDD